MRLHRLRVQAFGPFAEAQEVDVDALSAHGLFLLHGPTGAGKSSVLDAICFALYGRVPGARGSTTRLRSDHAPADMSPQVLVEISVGGRRFEVTRSPAWERPKKRGTGTTTEQAKTLLRELVDGRWEPLTNRNDEASQLLTDVLGMGIDQFTKVVLLPQGEFAAFLRAPAEERRPLLQRLFGTDRFADVESWLAEQRRDLARKVEHSDADIDRLLARASQAVSQLPGLGAVAAETGGSPVDPVAFCGSLRERASAVAATARSGEDQAAATRDRARTEYEELADALHRADRLQNALAEREALVETEGLAAQAKETLRLARAAATVSGHLETVDSTAADLLATKVAHNRAVASVADTGEDAELAPDALRERARSLREGVGTLAALLEVEAQADQLRERLTVLTRRRDTAIARVADLEGQLADVTARRREHEQRLVALTEQAADLGQAEQTAVQAQTVVEAAERSEALRADVADITARLVVLTDDAQQAKEHWLQLRERRIAGMAAELSQQLEDGQPCPVCGSPEHPEPARSDAAGVSAESERQAHERSDELSRRRAGLADELAGVRARLAQQEALCAGRSADDARAEALAATDRVTAARRAHAERERTQWALDALGERATALAAQREDAAETAAALGAELAEVERGAADLDARCRSARGDDESIAARRERLLGAAAALDALVAAGARLSSAEGASARAREQAELAARAAGFADLDEVRAAALPNEVCSALDEQVRAHADALAGVTARLNDPEMRTAAEERDARAAQGVHDAMLRARVQTCREQLREQESTAQQAAEDRAVAEGAVRSLQHLAEQVAAEVAASEPLRRRHAVVADLAGCAEGTGGGNVKRMRLSSYVLAARLEQVAAAATVRLDRMSAGRYALVHSDAAERGGRRSGLGLQVVDSWTGQQRDTATLSGGESFLASLALALGLADVVQAEAGGTAIETLFVDEGFGTLDPETLDEVMAVLDGLRDGGRAVGVISHVEELRQRIPARLEVLKTRTGSHLRPEHHAA
ncbi:MAG TPA: SMC family ATPase [Actinomycetales bacterium]|nr:SMC family ATPase [Actinomycetales bacterium]